MKKAGILEVYVNVVQEMQRSCIIYGMETLPVAKSQERRMEVADMRMLRFANGLTRMDRVRNDKLKVDLGTTRIRLKAREWKLI